ncbi:chromosome segregation protein SMC [Leptospira congkakensis]|uniref:Chromosome segregation protein SMC n=1 Tax=Leptospira congkakensis TaxID=2484932 RepID=A0A4Z1AB71_9LEPT|nr:AAA family ATPase [Leptospira congkakensis]TGL86704.1 chromosome segregation protein SMC [Leptospira congkakensis]TGL93751.1 chromosome segregation protein SMC [Leptospira congkakensis]TGL94843.1 chromosome segregation protein SMC [Leptospira congkakensis]
MIPEYKRFIEKLKEENSDSGLLKIAQIVYDNLDKLEPLGTNRGKRSIELISLAQSEYENKEITETKAKETEDTDTHQIKRLTSLSIKSFRGFTDLEEFDLDDRIVLLFGPNGTGKSSFCEALEYGLLGFVEEAESKRFSRQEDYLKNARLNNFSPPILKAKDIHDSTIPIFPDEEKYRFCFVEKNRIDNFSRIAAKTPTHQEKLIGSLFGLERFNEFVKNFSTEFDTKYIDLVGIKNEELAEKRKILANHEEVIKNKEKTQIEILEVETKISSDFNAKLEYVELCKLIGLDSSKSRIEVIEEEINSPLPPNFDFNFGIVISLEELIIKYSKELDEKKEDYKKRISEINYRDLYKAILSIKDESSEFCPACLTPLDSVRENPFIRSEKGLQTLEYLSKLETEIEILTESIRSTLVDVVSMLKNIEYIDSELIPEKAEININELIPENNHISIHWWENKFNSNSKNRISLQKISDAVKLHNTKLEKRKEERESLNQELKSLRNLKEIIIRHDENKKTKLQFIEKADEEIKKFEIENKELIEAVNVEKEIVLRNQKITNSYQNFILALQNYRNKLPSLLIADLSDIVKDIYNSFNRQDPENDKIGSIRLPLEKNEKIEIAFNSNLDLYYDALHILSEGHIRCLGLSILLAKNVKEKNPILIFDDPVNAIDDEHRDAIRRTLYEDVYFENTQIILTTHGEEFFKDVHNLIGSEATKKSKSYVFLPHKGDNKIIVDSSPTPRNYILVARERLEKQEIRETLANSRRGLEFITLEIWKLLNKHGDGNLSLKLRYPKSPPELRNVTEQLRSKANKETFHFSNKQKLIESLDKLLGISGESKEWKYLNKGTHEESDRSEFEVSTVKTIVESLEQLEIAIR